MNSINNTVDKDSIIIACKKRAKQILKENSNTDKSLTFMKCLNLAAKEMNFNHWYELRATIKKKPNNYSSHVLNLFESLILKYFIKDYESLHFEIRNQMVQVKGRKYGVIEVLEENISSSLVKQILCELNINPLEYDWVSKEKYNIQTMPVYNYIDQEKSYDVVVVKKETFGFNHSVTHELGKTPLSSNRSKVTFQDQLRNAGFSEKNIQDIEFNLGNKSIFIGGVTGTQKTTSANILVHELKRRNIKVAEINEFISAQDLDKTIISHLKTDPDYIYIPETVTPETVKWLNKLIQSGHNVITTLHTNSIDGIYLRLKSLGFTEFEEDYTPNSLLIYQELNRVLCPHCKEKLTSLTKIMKDNGLINYVKKHERYEDAENNLFIRKENIECSNKNCHNGFEAIKINAETFNVYTEKENDKFSKYIRYHTMTQKEKDLTLSIERLRQSKIKEYLKLLSIDCESNKYERVLKGEMEI